jgi:DNA-binding MarR family transcriptional regulator
MMGCRAVEESSLSGESFADDYLPHLLVQAAHVLSAGLKRELHRERIQVPVWRVLAVLFGRTMTTVTDLANRCALQQPTLSKLLDRMEQQKLVSRTISERDRRIVYITLTITGRETASKLVDAARLHEAMLLARHPQVQGVKEALRVIIADSADTRRKGQ